MWMESTQHVDARHSVRGHRLFDAVNDETHRCNRGVGIKAGTAHEERRPRTNPERRRQRRIQTHLQVANPTAGTLLAVSSPTVVIPNWNGAHFLAECLQSLLEQSLQTDIVVVDGASTDGSQALVVNGFPTVTLLSLPGNRGFAAAVNAGIEHALSRGTEFIALLNNDAVADRQWLANLVGAAQRHPEAGTVTSKFLRYDREHIDSTGDFYSSWGWAYPRGRDEIDHGQFDIPKLQEVFCGSGGASLYRASMLKDVGLFDERYFAYLEDQDLGFRAQLLGWKARYEPAAIAYHHMMGTSATLNHFARYQTVRNCIYLYVKNMPDPLWLKYLPKYLLGLSLMAINDIRRRRFHRTVGAYLDVIRHLPDLMAERRHIQRRRSVSTGYIDSILVHRLPPTQRNLLRIRNALQARGGRGSAPRHEMV